MVLLVVGVVGVLLVVGVLGVVGVVGVVGVLLVVEVYVRVQAVGVFEGGNAGRRSRDVRDGGLLICRCYPSLDEVFVTAGADLVDRVSLLDLPDIISPDIHNMVNISFLKYVTA